MYLATVAVAGGGTGYTVNDVLTIVGGTFGIVATLTVSAVSAGAITAVTISANGYYSALPSTPASVTGGTGFGATFNLLTWGVSGLTITNAGSGYVEQPTVTFSGGGGSGAAAYATVGLGVIFRTLNAALDFYTPNGKSAFRVQDYAGSTGDGFWTAFGGNSSPILRSTGANSGSIQTSSGVPLQFGTNNGVEQFRVAHTASAVNYVQVTGAATGGSATISVQGSDANPNLNIVGKGTGAVLFTTNGRNAFAVEGGTSAASNFISVVNGATGVAPQIKVSGFSTDPDADLALTTKGTGVLRFGSLTTNADAPITGYITIKDSGGTVRKLAVIA
jgi:hypothetical protein